MKTILVVFLFILPSFCFSQTETPGKAIILHPSVGKLIDNSEKKTYQLFPEYRDSTFTNAHILKYNDSTFTIVVKNIKNQTIEKPISFDEMDKMYFQIEDISQKEKPIYNETKKKRKQSGPNHVSNVFIITDTLLQLTLISLNLALALAN